MKFNLLTNKHIYTITILLLLINQSFSQNKTIDSLKNAFTNAKHDTTRCNILNALIENENDDKIWMLYNDQLLKLADNAASNTNSTSLKHKFLKHKAGAYNNRGILAQQQGDSKKALENMLTSLKIEESINDKEGIAVSLTNIGYIYNSQGDIQKALDNWHKSVKIQEDIGDKRGMAYSLNNMGSVYNHQGDVYKALECMHRSLKIQEEIKDKKGIANSMNNIAGIYGSQGERKKALEYYLKSLKLRLELNDRKAIATSYNNIGFTYNHLGDNTKALEYYNKSLALREEIGDKAGIANSLNNIGSNYSKQGNEAKALECYVKSLKLQQEINHKEGISITTSRLAESMFKAGKINEALSFAKQSLIISQELGFPENINDAATILKKIYKQQNKYKEALEMHELEIQMRDSMINSETKKEAIKKSFQYQYEKKTAADSVKHAEEQKVKNAELTAQRAQLKQEKTQRFALYGGLILIAAFGVVVYNRFKITQRQKNIIEKQKEQVDKQRELADSRRILAEQQKEIIKEKQKEIIDSIQYASRIQNAILTSEQYITSQFKGEFFIYYQPKDIVSGDFYWATAKHGKFYLTTGDCTGHGVPGAFMSLLNISFLNENVVERGLKQTADILNEQRKQIIKSLNPTGSENSKDGMDCVLYALDISEMTLDFSAANNSLWLVRDKELKEYKGDKMPVGMYENENKPFSQHSINLHKGDIIYTFTDGYADQFGGPNGKKFMYKNFSRLILENAHLPMHEQKEILMQTMHNWKKDLDQIDDILVIGLKV